MSVFTNPASASAEQTAAYTAAVLELLGDRDPLVVLRTTPDTVHGIVDPLPDELTTRPERPGKWSIRQVLRHLADAELVWAWRMRLMLAQDRPTITGYDQDSWADRLGYADADARESLAAFEFLRNDNLRLLERASPEDMKRVGVHVARGEESLERLARLYAGHDLLHVRQLERILAAVT